MLLENRTWDKIREQFSEDEKMLLRAAVTGEVFCPWRGWVLDPDRLEAELRKKIEGALAEVRARFGALKARQNKWVKGVT